MLVMCKANKLCTVYPLAQHEHVCLSKGIAPVILGLGTQQRRMVRVAPWPLYSRGMSLGIHWVGCWVVPVASLEKISWCCQELNDSPETPTLYQVTVLTGERDLCTVWFVAVLYFDYIPWWGALLISIGVGFFCMLLVQFILVPYERKRVVGEFTVLYACVHRTT